MRCDDGNRLLGIGMLARTTTMSANSGDDIATEMAKKIGGTGEDALGPKIPKIRPGRANSYKH